ncbi:MAG: hypothetical protein ING82_16150 [Roseomonas sp.]|nr:hypothetical protein [Roseomonas sp.]
MSARDRYPGWSVVWVAFTVAVFAWGIGFYGPGVFLQTLHVTKGWPIAAISAAITAHFLIGAVIVAFLPELDLSRFCAAPLITYCAAKEMNHEHRQDG